MSKKLQKGEELNQGDGLNQAEKLNQRTSLNQRSSLNQEQGLDQGGELNQDDSQIKDETQSQPQDDSQIQNETQSQPQDESQVQDETQNQNQQTAQDPNSNPSPDKNKKIRLIIVLIILILLLGLGTWLTIFFFNDDNGEDIFNNLNLNRDGDLNVDVGDIYYDENSEDISLDGSPSETETIGSQPITVIPDDYRMSQEVPEQSVVVKLEDVPAGSINIIGTDNGFEPNEFSVSPGQEFTLTLTAQSASPIVLTFYDEAMAAVAIGCGPGDTRYVTFKAPTKTGEYIFVNDVFGKRDQVGKMIVR